MISGTVLSVVNNEPMTGASIYFNGTTIGTFVDESGDFSLPYDSLFSEIVISYLGYKTLTYNILPSEWGKRFKFLLEEDAEELETVNITSTRSKSWLRNLNRFKAQFIGNSRFADQTKILNEETLYFDLDLNTNTLKAYARAPIQIENKALGYRLDYDLQQFHLQRNTGQMSLLGYTRLTKLKGSKSKNKKWAKNKLIAYEGSFTHFIHALQNNALDESAYEVRQLSIIPNKDRPSDEAINSALQILQTIKQAENSKYRMVNVDSLQAIVEKRSLSRNISILDKNIYDPSANIIRSADNFILDFENHWQINYSGESISKLLNAGAYSKYRNQISRISLTSPDAIIDKYGLLEDPLSVLFEGFWAYEKIPYLLPLDYIKEQAEQFSATIK